MRKPHGFTPDNMSRIYYNGTDLFSGQPTPYVARDQNVIFTSDGRRVAQGYRYTLAGNITGDSFTYITGYQNILETKLANDIGDLSLRDDSGYTLDISGCKFVGISYENGSLAFIAPYSIEFVSFPVGSNVSEKRSEWRATKGRDGNISVSHAIFARGINTLGENNALENARAYVNLVSGAPIPNGLFPQFISGINTISLESMQESVDRLAGTYSLEQSFLAGTGDGINKTLSTTVESGSDGILTVTVDGSYKAGKLGSLSAARSAYLATDVYAIASGVYNGPLSLNREYLSSGVSEDTAEKSVAFNLSFNDWPSGNVRHNYTIQLTSGDDGVIHGTIDGRIQGLGPRIFRFDKAEIFFSGMNPYQLVNTEFNNKYSGAYPLNPVEQTNSVGRNRFEGIVSYSYNYDNRTLPSGISGVKDFQYTISELPPIPILVNGIVPYSKTNNNTNYIEDISCLNRGSISVEGRVIATTGTNAAEIARKFLNENFQSEYINTHSETTLEALQITEDIYNNTASFNCSFSYKGDNILDGYDKVLVLP